LDTYSYILKKLHAHHLVYTLKKKTVFNSAQSLWVEESGVLFIWKLQPISSSFVVWEWLIWPVIELFSTLIGLTDLFSISCLKSLILPTPKFNGLGGHAKK